MLVQQLTQQSLPTLNVSSAYARAEDTRAGPTRVTAGGGNRIVNGDVFGVTGESVGAHGQYQLRLGALDGSLDGSDEFCLGSLGDAAWVIRTS